MSVVATEDMVRPVNGRKPSQSLQQQATTGVILFNSRGQLLFMNKEAQALIRHLQPLFTRENGTCLIPQEIHAVVRDLQCEERFVPHSLSHLVAQSLELHESRFQSGSRLFGYFPSMFADVEVGRGPFEAKGRTHPRATSARS